MITFGALTFPPIRGNVLLFYPLIIYFFFFLTLLHYFSIYPKNFDALSSRTNWIDRIVFRNNVLFSR